MVKKILLIFGTRPEAIKMAPLVNEFKKNSNFFNTKVCVTAQHREMLDQVLDFFDIVPEYDLNIMKENQDLNSLSSRILKKINPIINEFKPDFVFVHGDTTTSMISALASFYNGIKICHVEAGLRTYNKKSPFPEEINRQITSRLCDYHFAPTINSKNNLLMEGINENQIHLTGNTVVDALFDGLNRLTNFSTNRIENLKPFLKNDEKIILVTAHRRENYGKGIENICKALVEIAKHDKIKIIITVHPNPKVKEVILKYLKNIDNILLVEPLSYPEFIWIMSKSEIILSDSGGLQEEAPSLGKPLLLLRDTTERPEAIDSGNVILVGTNKNKIIKKTLLLLSNISKYNKMSEPNNPFGDGHACKRIVNFIKNV